MKTFLTAAILGITGLAGAAGAEAQDFRNTRNDRHGRRADSRHNRHHAPRVERTWVAPRYESVFVGYDHCGKPMYRTVCISSGYWAYRRC